MDDTDRALLVELQENCDRSAKELANALAKRGYQLMGPAVAARKKRLIADGLIQRAVVLLDAKRCGFNLYVLLVRLKDGSTHAEDAVSEAILSIPEVVEFHTCLGDDVHNVVKLMADDVARVNTISRLLRSLPQVDNVTSLNVAETRRYSTAVPINAPMNGSTE